MHLAEGFKRRFLVDHLFFSCMGFALTWSLGGVFLDDIKHCLAKILR